MRHTLFYFVLGIGLSLIPLQGNAQKVKPLAVPEGGIKLTDANFREVIAQHQDSLFVFIGKSDGGAKCQEYYDDLTAGQKMYQEVFPDGKMSFAYYDCGAGSRHTFMETYGVEVCPTELLFVAGRCAGRHQPTIELTDNNFKELTQRHKQLIVFTKATWCYPCNKLTNYLDGLIEDLQDTYPTKPLVFAYYDCEDWDSSKPCFLTDQFQLVHKIPVILFFKDGQYMGNVLGFRRNMTEQIITDYIYQFYF